MSSVIHKLRHTPLSDLVRGELSARLDFRSRLREANLPPAATTLIENVVRATRLWRSERLQVVDELIAHFQDGIELGQSADDLVERFGDTRTVAKLITRAKRRARHPMWRMLSALRWVFVAMIVFYGISAAVFFLGKPTVKVDYIAQANQGIEQYPESERAWPIYRQAILAVGDEPKPHSEQWQRMFYAQPGTKHWPALLDWLARHENAIALAVQGAQTARLGFVLGADGSVGDMRLWPQSAKKQQKIEMLSDLYLPHLDSARTLAIVLSADAAAAREQRDAARFMRDIDALLNMSQQIHDSRSFLLGDYATIGLWAVVLGDVDRALSDSPKFLSDADLRRLAHRLSKPIVAADVLTFSAERTIFYDAMQRAYTDDGHGDGRLTSAALPVLRRVTGGKETDDTLLENLAGAAAPGLVASRREVMQLFDRVMDEAEVNLHRPLREATWKNYEALQHEQEQSKTFRLRYFPISFLLPSLTRPQVTAERMLATRDGVVCGIALEIFNRHAGRYPDKLSDLSPNLLPNVPADPITGGSLHYRLIDGKPLVYSVGVDRDDDGGRMSANRDGTPSPWNAAIGNQPDGPLCEGDWVLYPQPKFNLPDDE